MSTDRHAHQRAVVSESGRHYVMPDGKRYPRTYDATIDQHDRVEAYRPPSIEGTLAHALRRVAESRAAERRARIRRALIVCGVAAVVAAVIAAWLVLR